MLKKLLVRFLQWLGRLMTRLDLWFGAQLLQFESFESSCQQTKGPVATFTLVQCDFDWLPGPRVGVFQDGDLCFLGWWWTVHISLDKTDQVIRWRFARNTYRGPNYTQLTGGVLRIRLAMLPNTRYPRDFGIVSHW